MPDKKWDTTGCKIEFDPRFLKSSYTGPVFHPLGTRDFGKAVVRLCVRCKAVYPLAPCTNCGATGFVPGRTTEGVAGIFCLDCDRGFSNWTCEKCGTSNPIKNSLAEEKSGGCFIATTVYGTPEMEEVLILRKLRDRHLSTNAVGQFLIGLYYRSSPSCARYLSQNEVAKTIVRVAFLGPLVSFCKKLLGLRAADLSGVVKASTRK